MYSVFCVAFMGFIVHIYYVFFVYFRCVAEPYRGCEFINKNKMKSVGF